MARGSHSRVLDRDDFNGVTTMFHWDEADQKFYIEEKMDVEPLIDYAKASYNGFDERARWGNDPLHHVAALPPVIYADLQKKGILDDPDRLKAWLNDRDNRMFRTRPGRL